MAQRLFRILPVALGVFFALGMSAIWAISRLNFQTSTPVVGDPVAYGAAAIVGLGAMLTLISQEHRIHDLEKRLKSLEDRTDSPPPG